MPKFLCLTSYHLDGKEFGGINRDRNIFRLLSQIGEVRVVVVNPCEFTNGIIPRTTGGFALVDRMRYEETKIRSVVDRLRYQFDGQFINTYWEEAPVEDRKRLQQLMAEHDLIWIHNLRLANAFGLWRWPKTVLDFDDVPSGFHRTEIAQAKGVVKKLRLYRQMRRWRRREKAAVRRFDALCVCSEADRQVLGSSDKIFVVPNGFNAPKKDPVRQIATPPRIGFIGTLKHRPNAEGLTWFLDSVWPRILRAMPQTKLRLIGEASESDVWKKHPNLDSLGWVADTDNEMATWSLSIVPIFIGGGTRVKIANLFSRKCPVVATSLGAFGYGAVNGREILIADSADEFADKCLQILKNPSEGELLAENAWRKFLESWTWDSFADRIANIAQTVLQKKVR